MYLKQRGDFGDGVRSTNPNQPDVFGQFSYHIMTPDQNASMLKNLVSILEILDCILFPYRFQPIRYRQGAFWGKSLGDFIPISHSFILPADSFGTLLTDDCEVAYKVPDCARANPNPLDTEGGPAKLPPAATTAGVLFARI